MNLEKLFGMQKLLDEKIYDRFPELKEQNNLDWKILALQVELGECANEWRVFKKWSKDQRPRTEIFVDCKVCDGTGDANYEMVQEEAENYGGHEYVECESCGGSGSDGPKNPLLEEYVDCLHFILSIGNDLGLDGVGYTPNEDYLKIIKSLGINKILVGLISTPVKLANGLHETRELRSIYSEIVVGFRTLGELLGFTWEEIESAYISKNEINHSRQENGY